MKNSSGLFSVCVLERVCALTERMDIALCISTGSNSAVAPVVACVALTFTKVLRSTASVGGSGAPYTLQL